jgi:hypothetical protein
MLNQLHGAAGTPRMSHQVRYHMTGFHMTGEAESAVNRPQDDGGGVLLVVYRRPFRLQDASLHASLHAFLQTYVIWISMSAQLRNTVLYCNNVL